MTQYLRGLIVYFESVLHPASGFAEDKGDKKRKAVKPAAAMQPSPECFNIRASAKKQDKNRRNPAP